MSDPYGDARAKQEFIDQHEANRLRQERKVIAAFAYRQDGHPDTSFIGRNDVQISSEMRNAVIADMASGAITRSQEREFLECIARPVDLRDGYQKAMFNLNTKHERRILAEMSNAGFNNWNTVSENNLREFTRQHPTPMDFDSTAQNFINEIGYNNGAEKRRQYEDAMYDFRHKV